MDNVDIAQQQQEMLFAQQLAIAHAQAKTVAAHNQNRDGDYECIDCGEIVEPQRVKLGLTMRCICCQQHYEKQRG